MKKQLVLVLAIATLSLTSCDEDPTISPPWKNDGGAKPIAITSFYPESGEGGIVVSIFGENFGTSVSDSYVTFNGKDSEVLQVRPGIVTVRVPLNLAQGDYEINLSARGQRVTSLMTFKVTGSEKMN
jgi:IPT/TIG domain